VCADTGWCGSCKFCYGAYVDGRCSSSGRRWFSSGSENSFTLPPSAPGPSPVSDPAPAEMSTTPRAVFVPPRTMFILSTAQEVPPVPCMARDVSISHGAGPMPVPHLAQDVSASHGVGFSSQQPKHAAVRLDEAPMHATVHPDEAPDAASSGASHEQPTSSSNVSIPDQQLSSSGSDQLILPHRTRLQGGIKKPKEFTDGTVRYGNLAGNSEPFNLQEALSTPHWKSAMQDEYSALMRNNIWHLVPPQLMSLIVSEFSKSNKRHMVLLIGIKLA
jgi:hypothetical protein